MSEKSETAETCVSCAHSTDAAADKMPGWLLCDLASNSSYRPPQAACSFSPVRWQPKARK